MVITLYLVFGATWAARVVKDGHALYFILFLIRGHLSYLQLDIHVILQIVVTYD